MNIESLIESQLEYAKKRGDASFFESLIKNQEKRGLSFNKKPVTLSQNSYSALNMNFDCDGMIGTAALHHITDQIIERSISHYTVSASISNLENPGHIGFHLKKMALNNLICIAFQATSFVMSNSRSHKRSVGNNLISIALPSTIAAGKPIVLDVSLGNISTRKVVLSAAMNSPISPNCVIGSKGEIITNPNTALNEGAILPISGHKGASIAIAIQALVAGLSQSAIQANPSARLDAISNNSCFIYTTNTTESNLKFINEQIEIMKNTCDQLYLPG